MVTVKPFEAIRHLGKQLTVRLLLLIAIGCGAVSCIYFDLGPWTKPYDSYNSGIKVNGKEYHVPGAVSIEFGGQSKDDVLNVIIGTSFCSTNYKRDTSRFNLGVFAYIDSCTVSGVPFEFELMTAEDPQFSKYDSLRLCFDYPEKYGRIETPRVTSYFSYQNQETLYNKRFYIKSGTIIFWVGRSWGGGEAEPLERFWSFKRCEFEFVAEATDGERLVVTEGYLGRK